MSPRATKRRRRPPGDGAAFIVVLLSSCLVLVAALAWQAHAAARSHRAMAESVLRDYARLAADELIRRSVSEVGFYGLYKLLGPLRDTDLEVLTSEAWARRADAPTRRALPLARYFFELGEKLETAGSEVPNPAVESWLTSELASTRSAEGEGDGPFEIHHAVLDGEVRTVVLLTLEDGASLRGFEVAREQLGEWFERVVSRRPLLPPSLTQATADEQVLALTVTDQAGREVFALGREEGRPTSHSKLLAVEVSFGDRYQGLFEGTVARVALYPEAADTLVIGGLPRSRLPLLVALLALTSGLLITAIAQLQRSRALARLRSDFVSRVSHELRTPLTQIRMFAETLMLGRVRSEDERLRSLEIIDQEARRLGHLVENILQFSRGERGAVELSPRPTALVPLVRALVKDFTPVAGGNGVRFEIHPADDVQVIVDEDALRQILLNLLDNAVKYGPSGQRVRIGVERVDGGLARLSVDDQGPGIPVSERRKIWRSYHRLERDRRSAVAGTGIGLSVVRELVALQSGSARVETGEDGGAAFVIELPRADVASSPASEEVAEAPA